MQGKFELFQGTDTKAMKSEIFKVIKRDYLIKTLHIFAAQLILQRNKKKQEVKYEKDELFRYQKELDRELAKRSQEIEQSEKLLEPIFSNTIENFKYHIKSLNLPVEISEKYFNSSEAIKNPNLMYVYSSHYGGSRIIPKDQYEQELDFTYDI